MALLVILICMGTVYSLTTNSRGPIRALELIAVWTTLALIAIAVLSETNPAISLPIAALIAAPLWYLTLSASQQQALSDERDTMNLWRHWRATTGAHAAGSADSSRSQTHRASLATRLRFGAQGDVLEEIELTQAPTLPMSALDRGDSQHVDQVPVALRKLELAPVEASYYHRGRRV